MCPKGSGPHSAAKQRRSFRVPPINHPEACVPKAVKATFCSRTGPFFRGRILQQNKDVPFVWLLYTIWGQCVPEAAQATFCSKTGPLFSCGCSRLCALNGVDVFLEATPCSKISLLASSWLSSETHSQASDGSCHCEAMASVAW